MNLEFKSFLFYGFSLLGNDCAVTAGPTIVLASPSPARSSCLGAPLRRAFTAPDLTRLVSKAVGFRPLQALLIETCSAAVRLVMMVGGHFAVGYACLLHESSPLEESIALTAAGTNLLIVLPGRSWRSRWTQKCGLFNRCTLVLMKRL